MFESLSATQTMIALMLFVLMVIAVGQALRWRSLQAKLVYLGQCDVAMKFPRFSNPALMKLDLRDKTADGDRDAFETYEGVVGRLVYGLDEEGGFLAISQWVSVA